MEKDSFILHNDQFECFSLLSMEQRGLLITAIFEFSQTGTTTQDLPDATHMAYHLITRQLNRDSQKYKRICEKRKAAIESRYARMNTNEYKCIQENTNVTDTDTDTETDTDTDTETDTDVEKEINKEKELPQKSKNDGKIDEKKPSVMEQRFNQFWSAYPKKVGKAYAEQCFKKLKPTAELTQKMLDAISEQKKSSEWTRDNGQFIPHPSTWLNQGRWQDELSTLQEAVNHSAQEVVIPKFCNETADDMFEAALKRTYG